MIPSSPSNPNTAKRLSGLLQLPQEPFNLEVYLLEKGCPAVGRRIMGSQATPFCWLVNCAKRLPRKLISHGIFGRGRAANFLRCALAKDVYGKAVRKALQWNIINNHFNGSGKLSCCFHEDSKQQLSSLVSVLELQKSDVISASRSLTAAAALLILLWIPHQLLLASAVEVSHLVGFHGALPFRMETGYVGMEEDGGGELFYYFVESERNPSEDPLILWLTGGPGCSAFIGVALHMGPLQIVVDNFDGVLPTLVRNPYSWTKISSMIFLDWPFGSGFSYSRNDEDYVMDDVRAIKLIYYFLRKWLLNHPHLLSNPFYMGGESYGGKMATLVAHEIVEGNENGQHPLINLKGYVIGNAVTGEKGDKNSRVPHAYGLGIIPEELYKIIQTSCVGEDYLNPRDAICAKNLKTFNEFISEINVFSVLDPKCPDELPSEQETAGFCRAVEDNSENFLCQPSNLHTNCITPDLLANYWANNHLSRQSIRIKEGTVGQWRRCNFDYIANNYTRSIPSSLPHHVSLTTRGYRALVYSGDHDLQIPFLGTLGWIKSLGFSVLAQWRSWQVEAQVAGYTMAFSNNLTFATVKGGGHVAPVKRPKESFAMFERWISQQSL